MNDGEPAPPTPPAPCERQCWYRRIGCIEPHTHTMQMGQDGGWQNNVEFIVPDKSEPTEETAS